jgi:hypothetical protein
MSNLRIRILLFQNNCCFDFSTASSAAAQAGVSNVPKEFRINGIL